MTSPHHLGPNSPLHRELNELEAGSPALKFFVTYWSRILWSIPVFLLFLVLVYYLLGSKTTSEADFVKMDREFLSFQRAIMKPGEEEVALGSLGKLDLGLNQDKHLQAKYDGPIAQLLFSSGMNERALPYALRTLARTDASLLPDYALFGDATLAFSKGNEDQGKALADKLQQVSSPSALSFFNTLRLIALQKDGEVSVPLLDLFKRKIQEGEGSYPKLAELFDEGELSLVEYLNHLGA